LTPTQETDILEIMENMTKGQIWLNKPINRLERINHVKWNEPFARTEHYFCSEPSDPILKSDLEKVSDEDALSYVDKQRSFESKSLPPLPLKAGV
tara:strand:+ start:624 stop:908 length:285 start_codon:yes stop_codon:yes gene_type:complete